MGGLGLWLKNRLRDPSLGAPDIRTLDAIWTEVFEQRTYDCPRFDVRSRDAVVLDVGAHVGVFSAWVAERYRPRAVFAFEASPVTYGYLVRNLLRLSRTHPVTSFLPLQGAVSERADQIVTLYHQPGRTATSTVRAEGQRGGEPRLVRTTTVSQQLLVHRIDQVDLLKIDVEGHFLEVLRGIDEPDFAKIRNLAIECDWMSEGAPERGAVEGLLRDRGYKTEVDDPRKRNNVIVYAYR